MKCPSCGANVQGRICMYCDSLIPTSLLEEYGLNDVEEMTEVEEKEKVPEKKVKKKSYVNLDKYQTVTSYCETFIEKCEDDFAIADPEGKEDFIGGKFGSNLIDVLNIPSEDRILFIHDDSWFKRGKNGFAVTDRGFYVKEMYDPADFLSWEDFAIASKIEKKEDSPMNVIADGKTISYYCGGGSVQDGLVEFFRALQDIYNEYGEDALC